MFREWHHTILSVTTRGMFRCAGHFTFTREKIKMFKILVGKPERKKREKIIMY
jgi:hypothetical protein